MPNRTTDSETGIDRRTVLKSTAIATGVGLVGVSGFTGAAAAKGHKGVGKVECGCGTLLAKYEWKDGEFVFDKGRDSLGINGDEFEFTNIETNEDGEPLAFEWESYSYDEVDPRNGTVPGHIYDVSCLTVKAGQDVETVEDLNWASSGEYERDDKYAISNVQFCIECAFWQVDLGEGEVPEFYTEDPETSESYHPPALIAYGTNGRGSQECDDVATGTSRGLANVDFGGFNYDLDDLSWMSATFTVTGDEPQELHLVASEMPGPFERDEIAWGPRYDLVHDTFAPGEHTITIDLPTV